MYELTWEITGLHTSRVADESAAVVNLRFPSVYHFNNLTGKFIALIPCTVAHGKEFLGNILSLYATWSMLLGELAARLLFCD